MTLNKISENIKKNIILLEYHIFSQNDRNILLCKLPIIGFTPSILDSEKNVSRTFNYIKQFIGI